MRKITYDTNYLINLNSLMSFLDIIYWSYTQEGTCPNQLDWTLNCL